MDEAQVSLDHTTHPLPQPFMVLATQNPREYEGTYPLPESQLDRFLLRIRIGYPDALDEKTILRARRRRPAGDSTRSSGSTTSWPSRTRRTGCKADEAVLDYVLALAAATRRSPLLALGASPRGSLALLRAARAQALADGRDYLIPDDVKTLAVPALAHRVLLKHGTRDAGAGTTRR